MHGSAIAGSHWVVMTFESPVTELSRIVLDWETAFSPYYRFEVSSKATFGYVLHSDIDCWLHCTAALTYVSILGQPAL